MVYKEAAAWKDKGHPVKAHPHFCGGSGYTVYNTGKNRICSDSIKCGNLSNFCCEHFPSLLTSSPEKHTKEQKLSVSHLKFNPFFSLRTSGNKAAPLAVHFLGDKAQKATCCFLSTKPSLDSHPLTSFHLFKEIRIDNLAAQDMVLIRFPHIYHASHLSLFQQKLTVESVSGAKPPPL